MCLNGNENRLSRWQFLGSCGADTAEKKTKHLIPIYGRETKNASQEEKEVQFIDEKKRFKQPVFSFINTFLENYLYKLYLHSWNEMHIFTAQNIVAVLISFTSFSQLTIPRTQYRLCNVTFLQNERFRFIYTGKLLS